MDTMTNDTSIMALFEIFFSCQKVLLHSLDYREIKFSRHQIYTLLALGSREPMSMGRVAESLAASREQATRVVASLVEEGYVERFYDETNRKRVYVRLTSKGRIFIEKEKDYVKHQLEARLAHLSDAELDEFLTSISSLKAILKKVETVDK